jgi:hypothetical protein
MKRTFPLVALVSVVLLGACYRVTVETGAPPANKKIDLPWQKSWIFGLVPPDTIRSKATCPGGVSTVMVEHSFVNGIANFVTFGIFTPIHPVVSCAMSPRPTR